MHAKPSPLLAFVAHGVISSDTAVAPEILPQEFLHSAASRCVAAILTGSIRLQAEIYTVQTWGHLEEWV
jgi:hypothetical protein